MLFALLLMAGVRVRVEVDGGELAVERRVDADVRDALIDSASV